jgi:hypothetical protein
MYSTACLTVISSVYDRLRDVRLKLTAVDSIGLLVRNLNAELLFMRQRLSGVQSVDPPTSSIAMTTSTVSRLSRPRSLWKCDSALSYQY